MRNSTIRTRWAAIGASIAVVFGAGSIGIINADVGSGERAIFVPVEPCRLLDTRPNQGIAGRKSPLGDNDTHVIDLNESNGDCDALPDATSLALNVTPVSPSADTYLSFVPGSLVPPSSGYTASSNLNPSPSQPPTPNAVEVDLDDGRFTVYNRYGAVHVVIDVVGYYADHHHDDRYYGKSETYTQQQVDDLVDSAKQPGGPVLSDGSVRVPLTGFTAQKNNVSSAAPWFFDGVTLENSSDAADEKFHCVATNLSVPDGTTFTSFTIVYGRVSTAPAPTPGLPNPEDVKITVRGLRTMTATSVLDLLELHFDGSVEAPTTAAGDLHTLVVNHSGATAATPTSADDTAILSVCAAFRIEILDIRYH